MSSNTLSSAPRRNVARAATIIMLAFVASRGLGLVREAVIGARFGALDVYAAYLAAFRVPDLIFNLVAGGALASAFLPTFTGFLTRGEEASGWRLASAVANWLLLGLGALSLLAALLAPWLVTSFIAPGYPPALTQLTADLMRFMLISTVIFSLSGLLMSILNAYEHFLLPALAPVMYNLGILFGALVLAPRIGIFGLAWGVVLGASAHALIQLPALRHFGIRYAPVLGLRDPQLRGTVARVVQLMGPRVLGAAVVQLMFFSNTVIASFYDPAVLPALNYAWIVMLLPHGIFASSVATAIFPSFSRMASVGNQAGMRAGLAQTLRALLFVVLPSAVGLLVLRVPIIQLLFERGEFTHQTTLAVAWALGFYSVGLVAHALVEIVNRAFFALQDTLTPVLVGVGAMVGNIALSLLLVRVVGDPATLERGPQGALALANTLASTAEIILLLWLLRVRLGGLDGRALLDQAMRLLLAAAGMGAALWGLMQWPLVARLPVLVSAPLLIAAGGGIYLAIAWALRVEETRTLPRLLLRR